MGDSCQCQGEHCAQNVRDLGADLSALLRCQDTHRLFSAKSHSMAGIQSIRLCFPHNFAAAKALKAAPKSCKSWMHEGSSALPGCVELGKNNQLGVNCQENDVEAITGIAGEALMLMAVAFPHSWVCGSRVSPHGAPSTGVVKGEYVE